ncbi:Alcohol dehydrogenase [Variovorax sp. SRS16]|nr:Alcohol dehydrogenase [Variovorax sp. SRS16]
MVLETPGQPLRLTQRASPEPAGSEVRLRILACAVCRTDLHVVDGDLPLPTLPIVPGHGIVGVVDAPGAQVTRHRIGDHVGVPWLGHACGHCSYCHDKLCRRIEGDFLQRHGHCDAGAEPEVARQDVQCCHQAEVREGGWTQAFDNPALECDPAVERCRRDVSDAGRCWATGSPDARQDSPRPVWRRSGSHRAHHAVRAPSARAPVRVHVADGWRVPRGAPSADDLVRSWVSYGFLLHGSTRRSFCILSRPRNDGSDPDQ